MCKYRYDEEKNKKLKEERGIDFDTLMEKGVKLNTRDNTSLNHTNQLEMHILYSDYIYKIPFVVEEDGTLFLKTAFKNRDLNKIYNK